MLDNSNGQNPTSPVPAVDPNLNPVDNATAPLSPQPLVDEMATDISDLDNNPAAVVMNDAAGPAMPPAAPVNNQPAVAEDMFGGIPSLATEKAAPAAPQLPEANQFAGRPAKKSSIVGILLIVVIIIALIGGALAAYNFWSNSNSTEEDVLEESMELEEDIASYDFPVEEDLFEVDMLPLEDDLLGFDEELFGIGFDEMADDIILPPLSGDLVDLEEEIDVLEYEEINEEEIILDELIEEEGELELEEELIAEEESDLEGEILDDLAPGEDLDSDGFTNEEELTLGTDPYKADTDNDGLNDREEVMTYSTDPLDEDSDGDGYLDGAEVEAGYNPNGPGELVE